MSEKDKNTGPMLHRRTFLKLTGIATVASALDGCSSFSVDTADTSSTDETGVANVSVDDASAVADGVVQPPENLGSLPLPPMLEGDLSGGIRTFELNLQPGQREWIAGNPTATYGINGDFLGPTLHFHRGERVRLKVTNSLEEATTIHWHGLELPAKSDGGPYQIIDPGTTWIAEYDIIQRPLMAWYHPHQMHQTARHVYMGMAGLIYLDDPAQSVKLPSTYGVDDIPLVIQDRRFAADGSHPYSTDEPLTEQDILAGLKGEMMLVNGAIMPTATIQQGLIRLRILNGSNARTYNLGFTDDRLFYRIGNEGGLYEAPIETTRVLLAPAERAEILIDFGTDVQGTTIGLKSYSSEVVDTLFTGPGTDLADAVDHTDFDIMSFEIGEPSVTNITIPTAFEPIARMKGSEAVRMRSLTLSMRGPSVFINNAQMLDMDNVPAEINFQIPAGDVEIWTLTSTSGMAHPLHIHHRHFQILDIDGEAPPPQLDGWKDTILLQQDQVVRILLKFVGTADSEYPYMFHCHILEHEDAGMMGQFYIV